MRFMSQLFRHAWPRILIAGILLFSSQAALAAGVSPDAAVPVGKDAKGTLVYKGRSATLKYAWLVKGPYIEEPTKTVRRLILSARDISAELQACKTIMCADGQVTEGMTVDFDVSRRLNYWVALNGQKVQYSGTVTPDAFAAIANDAGHLAGRLVIDDVAAGGPKIDAEFNVIVFKEFKPDR